MITTINEWKLVTETHSKIKFENLHLDYHNQQHNYILNAIVDGEIVAYADYVEYRGIYTISMIEALVKGHKYGKAVMLELARMYGYENIERTGLTPDGIKLRKEVDSELNFDYKKYKESQNKHLSVEDSINKIRIKYPLAADFMSDMILFGYSKTWENWIGNKKINDLQNELQIIDFDINDLADITSWIKNSATNDNVPEDGVPYVVMQDLQKLI